MNAEIDDVNSAAPLVHAQSPSGGPGETLGAERQRLGWPVAEVSAFLHLSRHVVEAIERDDYSKLPSLTFATGYLRAYAKFLNMDPEEIIERFKKLGLHEAERTPTQRVLVKDVRVSDGPVKWMSYVVALALGGLVIVWWYNHSGAPQSSEIAKVNQASSVSPSAPQQTTATVNNMSNPINNTSDVVNSANSTTVTTANDNDNITIMPDAVDAPNSISNDSQVSAAIDSPNQSSALEVNKVHQATKAFSGWHNPDLE